MIGSSEIQNIADMGAWVVAEILHKLTWGEGPGRVKYCLCHI